MIVPWTELEEDTLRNLLEDYVTRGVSDAGDVETPLAARAERVRRLLESGEVVVWFDETTETVNILPRRELPEAPG
jgi:hypothetical protein